MFLIFTLGTLLQITHGQTAAGSVLHAASACYGDSSGQGLNQLVITCTEGLIYIENIRVALKPAVLGCPAVEHNLTPANQETCCTLNATADCVNTYRGYSHLDFYRDCNGRVSCSKPVVWETLTCPDPAPFPAHTVSNYMVLEYYCQTEGVYNSSCSDVTDCRYAHPECHSHVCRCEPGYTYVGSECRRDGEVGGVCLIGGSGPRCLDSNSECSFGRNCACKIGYAEQNSTCIMSSEALYRDEACYGALAENHIHLNCTTGYIVIDRLRVAAKPLIANCPELNANSTECCTSDVFNDCVNDYTGETVYSFHNCSGLQACTKPVVRQQLQCGSNSSLYPASSTFMIVDYHCLAKGQNFGICNTTGDCSDPAASCDKARCHCVEGYTALHYFDNCWQDGFPNGKCELESETACYLNGTLCDHGSRKCVCGDAFIAQNNGICDAENSYKTRCNSTTDCQMDNMVCEEGRCDCRQHFIYTRGQCLSDNDYNMSCDANTTCKGDNIVCKEGRCVCTPGYTYRDSHCASDYNKSCTVTADCPAFQMICTDGHCLCAPEHSYIQALCRPDGGLGGRCNSSLPCVDANTTCSTDTHTCQCETMYSEFENKCYKDGDHNGRCKETANCNFRYAICVDNRCICQAEYTELNGQCLPDGSNGAPCLNTPGIRRCLDENALCTDGRCVCLSEFQNVHGVCRQNQHLGGWCNSTFPCLDAYTNCSNSGTCECVSGYKGVNGSCTQVGSVGGTCFPNRTCSDKRAVCATDDIGQCMTGVCHDGVCQCSAGTALSLAGLCLEHGSTGGLCNGTIACRDENALCTEGRCTCKGGFKDINGVCRQDQHLGGWCNSTFPCLDALTNCSYTGTCECVSGYQGVNGSCVQVGDVGGVCSQERQCRDQNAQCVPDGQSLCAGTPCLPGLCDCLENWRMGPGGSCRKDCTSNKCMANAVCDNNTRLCECPQPFTAVSVECIAVGDVGGTCADVPDGGSPCRDQHAVCVNDTCICNEERNYVLRDRQCKKNDTYVTGQCGPGGKCKEVDGMCRDGYCVCKPGTISVNGVCSKGFDIPGTCNLDSGNFCNSSNTDCKSGICVCKSGFVPLFGKCKGENTSVVSKCPGDSPFNTLSTECAERMRAVVTSSVFTVVRRNPDCPVAMDTYEQAQFERCCRVHGEDCVLGTTGCNNSEGFSTYDVQEYVCVDDDAVISPGDNRTITGQPVFIVPPYGGGSSGGGGNGGTGNGPGAEICAIRASCLTEIAVYAMFIEQEKGADSACVPTLMFNAVSVRCPFTNPVFTSSNGFSTLNLTNPFKGGQYSLKVEASHPQAEVMVACGNAAPPQIGPPSTACGATGAPPTAYPVKQEDQSNSTALAVAVPVCILFVAAIAAALLIRFRDKIRNRFCPVKKMPDLHDPTPARTKFPGREEGVSSAPKADSAPRPPARLPPLGPSSTTPSNKRFRRGATLVEFITSQEKHMMKKSNMKDKLIVTMDDTPQSPNGDTGKPLKKKKGRKKLLNTAAHVFSAAKHMQSKVSKTSIIQEGATFTPKEDFYTYSAPNGGPIKHVGMRDYLDLPMGIQSASTNVHSDGTSVPPPAPRGQLPPIRAPPLEGLPPLDFMEAEALPSSIRMPSRQGLLANGTSSATSWAQVLPSSIGNQFLARGQGQHPSLAVKRSAARPTHNSEALSKLTLSESYRLLNLPGQSPLNSVYSRHSGEQDITDQSAAPNRKIIRRPSQLDIKTMTDE
ncbi:neurogenic locus notch homolog protein 1-like isoform X3 [Dreissena polymorpha]|uniref:neurogenic locus notch homolog protein 1-like isoform X3 n=1 Tax=Dreissena polymorpha TaxID=45954 RepID=UPI00226405AD|nr:neurogenic locus notch homolog protein 1-like isoform X3 [Dreissena polymorpha]